MERLYKDLAVDILITEGCVDRNRDSILCRVVADVFLCGWKGHGGFTDETTGIGILKEGYSTSCLMMSLNYGVQPLMLRQFSNLVLGHD